VLWLVPVANAMNVLITRVRLPHQGQRQRMVDAAQVANCV
jgi:hypothetical protein